MKNLFFSVLLVSFCVPAFSNDILNNRVTVRHDQDEEMVRDLLSKLEESMNNDNLRDYLSCFTPEYAKKTKKEAAVMFVEHDLSLEFDNFQIVETDGDQIEFVVKYNTNYTGDNVTTIANVLAERENDGLLVANQRIVSQKGEDGEEVSESPDVVCKDGKCRKMGANVPNAPKKRKEFSLFNDVNGKPDPDGIMWLDPNTLIEVYPEQYECIGCMRK